MERRRLLLASGSAAQLAFAVAGMIVAVRRRRFFDLPLVHMHGHPDHVLRESIFQGTALSAPVTTLVTQAVATTVLARRSSPVARRVLGVVGAVNVPGYLSERLGRRRLTRAGWDRLESPLLVASISLSAAMALLAFGSSGSEL
jgi:hypothetical protein